MPFFFIYLEKLLGGQQQLSFTLWFGWTLQNVGGIYNNVFN